MTPRKRLMPVLLLLLCLIPCAAWAQSPPDEAARLGKQAEALSGQGRYAEAIPLGQRALELTERALGPESPLTAKALSDQAELLRNAGDFARAEPLCRRALAIRDNVLGPQHIDTATSVNNLAVLLDAKGEFAQAEPLHRRALALREKILGPRHPDVAESLNNLALSYRAAGAPAKAEPLLLRALDIVEKAQGPQHEDVAACLNSLGLVQYDLNQFDKARASLSRAVAIREKALGPNHPDTAMALNNLGLVYSSLNDPAKAEGLYRRALAMQEKALGPEHPDTGGTVNNLAELFRETGDYAKADPLYQRALAILEKANGPEHPDTATVLDNYGDMLRLAGRFTQAEPLFQRALSIRRKAFGPESAEVAGSLANLANLAGDRGDAAKAEQLQRQALAIREKTLGPQHPLTGASLNDLALLARGRGDLAQAETLYKRALAIAEKAGGPDDPGTATALHNMAELYSALGDYPRAESLYKRALAIREKALGQNHRDTAVSLNNLALLYHDQMQLTRAEPYYLRALAIKERLMGSEHPSTAVTLNNLGELYFSMGDAARAEPCYRRALAVDEKVLGPEHPSTAVVLNNLAALYKQQGALAKAEPLYLRVLAIREKTLGPRHPEVAAILNNLAALSVAMGQYDKTLQMASRAQDISADALDQVLGFTSEEQKLSYLSRIDWEKDAFLSFIAQRMPQRPDAVKKGFEVWLRRKGIVLDAQRRSQEALVASGSAEAKAALKQLGEVRAELSRLSFAAPGPEPSGGPESLRRRMEGLERRKGELQATLSRLSQAYAQDQRAHRADAAQLAAALPPGSALVDLARVKAPRNQPGLKGDARFEALYIAFVLPAGRPEGLRLVTLGSAGAIDTAVAAYKQAILEDKKAELPQRAKALHDLAFAPLLPALGQTRRVFLATDGALSLVPFETFRGPEGRYLIEGFSFTYLAAGRDLLSFGQRQGAPGRSLVLGDPDFDLDGAGRAKALAGLNLPVWSKGTRSADMAALRFDPLPATRKEAQAVQAQLGPAQAAIFLGPQAQEEVLAQARGPRVLHLATHAFFLPAEDTPGDASGKGPQKAENPLLRSGFVLAGANRALGGDARAGGVVTAEKVMGLDLRGTELVVLSACSTGEGEVRLGEGVYGLRRAFTQAGAQGLVMSMWPVPDQETQELMAAFYGNMAEAGADRSEALRKAALRQLETARQRYKSDSPLYWGAFVFLGDPGTR